MSKVEKGNLKPVTTTDVLFYYANIMDYFRVILSMYSFYISKTNPVQFLICYFISFILDAFDGMVARAYKQTSKLGATLDMVTDRISTAGLLCLLGNLYPKCCTFFIFMIMLDVGSHWLQTHSGFLVDIKNENHKNLTENIYLIKLYYTNRYVLGITCLGAELFLLLLYLSYHYSQLRQNIIYNIIFSLCACIYTFKQVISILQIFGASSRIAVVDAKVANEKLGIKEEKKTQ